MKERPGDLMQQYFRYFCIESNIMEETFLLNSRVRIDCTRLFGQADGLTVVYNAVDP
jgi:hypothetical protein